MTATPVIPPFRVLMDDGERYRLTLLPLPELLASYEAGLRTDPLDPRHRKVTEELGGRLQRQGPCRSSRWAYCWSWGQAGIVRGRRKGVAR